MEISVLQNKIISGEYDSDLGALSAAVKARKELVSNAKDQMLKLSLKPGDRVRFKDTTKPKYLAGREATVTKINPKKILVKVDAPTDPWFDKGAMLGKSINTPLSLVEAI